MKKASGCDVRVHTYKNGKILNNEEKKPGCLDYFDYMWQLAKLFNPNKLNELYWVYWDQWFVNNFDILIKTVRF
jgi:hypothetical protein